MRLPFVLLLILFLLPAPSSAQDSVTWYFAWRESTGEIFAYDGGEQVNTLMRAERVGWWDAARISSDQGLVQAIFEGNAGFYLLSPNTAQSLQLNFDPSVLPVPLTEAYSAFRRNENFVVLLPDDYHPDEPALLVDLAAAKIEILTPNIFSAYQASFSEDDRTLRYMAQASSGVVTERERILGTGKERILRTGRYLSDFLGEEVPLPRCTSDCWVTSIDRTTNNIYEFRLPDRDPYINLLELIDDERAIAQIGVEFWLLDANSEPDFLGYVSATPSHWYSASVSPDRKWLLVSDSAEFDEVYTIWNLQDQSVIHEGEITGNFPWMEYFEHGFILKLYTDPTVYGLSSAVRYFAEDNSFAVLPADGKRSYFDLLNNGSVLYSYYVTGNNTEPGDIYRYDPESGSDTLLIEDAERIQLDTVLWTNEGLTWQVNARPSH